VIPGLAASWLLAVLAGAAAGTGLFLLVVSLRRLPPTGPGGPGRLRRWARQVGPVRWTVAVAAGLVALAATRWAVAGAGVTVLVLGWGGLSGSAAERLAVARLEALATWAESLRDTIAGAVGLEQAIPASLRAAAPSLREPLTRLIDRLHTRVPMPEALRRFADDLNDSSADLVIAALIINARLRGPGLRDLLGALSRSVREELDMRRKVNAERRATRRSAQIVVGVSVGLALALGIFDRGYVRVYGTAAGQLVLILIAGLYAAGITWMRSLARFRVPERLLASDAAQVPGEQPAAVAAWRGSLS
jgi:Flp pilus assembly protein TadB